MDEITEQNYLKEARQLLIKTGVISTGLLQRELRMGYSTAYRILDLLAEEGLVEPPQGVDPEVTIKRP
jgi:DNA segregation ATPase FtsK/SpoIIIE-like protein